MVTFHGHRTISEGRGGEIVVRGPRGTAAVNLNLSLKNQDLLTLFFPLGMMDIHMHTHLDIVFGKRIIWRRDMGGRRECAASPSLFSSHFTPGVGVSTPELSKHNFEPMGYVCGKKAVCGGVGGGKKDGQGGVISKVYKIRTHERRHLTKAPKTNDRSQETTPIP